MVIRCEWATKSPELMIYHDTRWGKPVFETNELFHALCLEIMQAGLTFQTVLKFEQGLLDAFDGFEVNRIAKFSTGQVEQLYSDKRIIRNHAKIDAIVNNARVVAENPAEFKQITWGTTNSTPIDHLLTEDLDQESIKQFVKKYVDQYKKMGLTRMGPTTTYSFLQAAGIVNDHLVNCEFR
ncbi:DNA-3-methyladenine glycosylase [Lentilactobacillus curieae]|uniref:DNA-3-methyladenine glycosylase n=1 Tax=Lentilactobacillus curieae TaxID=1138822 RepID=A0A1S6QKT8_9LACO|nr:DNA-3-methyladenine glycosylase I [Lentilactobacillus curieae]AQW22242.1 DNA-3-methyladenine glycosylase [Lentilactobacillus curieae]